MACNSLTPNSLNEVALVRSLYGRNVGLCARAMQNLGYSRLNIVDPKFERGQELQQGAARADRVWQAAAEFSDWQKFCLKSQDKVLIGLSGKSSDRRKVRSLEEVLLDPQVGARRKVFVFGPEDDGLLGSELDDCHKICALPASHENTSYNLSHAVLLTLFISNQCDEKLAGVSSQSESTNLDSDVGSASPSLHASLELVDQWLESIGFDLSRPQNAARSLKRILFESCPSESDIALINSVLHQTLRKRKG